MREILFRGKRIDTGEWVYGVPVIGITTGVFMVWIESKAKRGRGELSLRDVVKQAEVIPETVGQYTGLEDKNGQKIFEGDILDCGDRIVRVEWNGPSGTWDSVFIKYIMGYVTNGVFPVRWKYRATVIGNIHDNPELMEV